MLNAFIQNSIHAILYGTTFYEGCEIFVVSIDKSFDQHAKKGKKFHDVDLDKMPFQTVKNIDIF